MKNALKDGNKAPKRRGKAREPEAAAGHAAVRAAREEEVEATAAAAADADATAPTQASAKPAAAAAAASNSGSHAGSRRDVSPTRAFFRAWAWKREHRPDRDRFHRPYVHALLLQQGDGEPAAGAAAGAAAAAGAPIVIRQCKFGPEGFASTVWDSSIVLARWLERHRRARATGRRVLDLSAGCGLVGIVAARLGAAVVATDLAPNLPLLRENCEANAPGAITVLEHRWGGGVAPLLAAAPGGATGSSRPFDLVLACDVMYVEEAAPDLVDTLAALARAGSSTSSDATSSGSGGGGGGTEIVIAHGRNRGAEPAFLRAAAAAGLRAAGVPGSELDPVYQCSDVSVLRLALAQR